ncbi:MAG: xanthine dehydrogenase family protein molybdopterin-binding subunit [Bacillota bacterium]
MDNSISRIDAVSKVLGKAQYAADIYLKDMLYVKVLRSKYPHAEINHIDTTKARQVPGVHLTLTAKDIPGMCGQEKERPVLCEHRVRYTGDGIALVAAETSEVALKALESIVVDYTPLEVVSNPLDALKTGSISIHSGGNETGRHKVRKGNISEGFEQADLIFEREYKTSRVQHAAIEPEAAVAVMEGHNKITIYCPCKSPFNVRRMVAEALGINLGQVRVVQCVVGGSFGGKDSDMAIMASRVALVTWLSGRSSKMVFTREESLLESTTRHPYILKYRVGATKTGHICAMKIDIIADAGAYQSKTPLVTWRSAVEATGPYNVPHVSIDIVAAYTNNPVSDALRGFGSPQVNFAVELLIDELAAELNIDPLQLRIQNCFSEGAVSATGQVLHDVAILECLQKAAEATDYQRKKSEYTLNNIAGSKHKKRGIGMACSFRGSALGAGGEGIDAAGAIVSIQKDGTIVISSGIGEVGQGFHTVAARIVMETLGVPLERLIFNQLDTSSVPDSGPTVASRGTVLGGSAVKIAAEKIKDTLLNVATKRLKVSKDILSLENDMVLSKEVSNINIDITEVVKWCFQEEKSLYEFGWYSAPKVWWDSENGCGHAYFSYTYAADVAEVEVDLSTGKVDIIEFTAVHDVGNAINPASVKGQICGGVAMGIGYALTEELNIKDSVLINSNFDTYLLPTSMDVGKIKPIFIEHKDRFGPFGARGLGEPATQIVAPAIINAICDACLESLYLKLEKSP